METICYSFPPLQVREVRWVRRAEDLAELAAALPYEDPFAEGGEPW